MRTQSAKIENFSNAKYGSSLSRPQEGKSEKNRNTNVGVAISGYSLGYTCAYFSVSGREITITAPLIVPTGNSFTYSSAMEEKKEKRVRRTDGELLTTIYDTIRDEMIEGLAKRAELSVSGRKILRAIFQKMDRLSVKQWNLRLSEIGELAGTKYDTTNRQMKRITEALPEVFDQIVVGKKGMDESEWTVTRPNRGTFRQAKAMCAEGRLPGLQKGPLARRAALRAMEAQNHVPGPSGVAANQQNATLREDSLEEKLFQESSVHAHLHQEAKPELAQEAHGMAPGAEKGRGDAEVQAQREVAQALLELQFDPQGADYTAKRVHPAKAKQVAGILRTVGQDLLATITQELAKTPGQRNNARGVLAHRLTRTPWRVLLDGDVLARARARKAEEEARRLEGLSRSAKSAGVSLAQVPEALLQPLMAWVSAQEGMNLAGASPWAFDQCREAKLAFTAAALADPAFAEVPTEVATRLAGSGLRPGSAIWKATVSHQSCLEILNRLGLRGLLPAKS